VPRADTIGRKEAMMRAPALSDAASSRRSTVALPGARAVTPREPAARPHRGRRRRSGPHRRRRRVSGTATSRRRRRWQSAGSQPM